MRFILLWLFKAVYLVLPFYKTNRELAKFSNGNNSQLSPMINWLKPVLQNHGVLMVVLILLAYWQIALFRHFPLWDTLDATFPSRFFAVECLRNGKLPLWMPYQFTGYPFYADPQSGCWYPITWLFALFGRYTLVSLDIEYIINVIIGAFGMYALTENWTKDKQAALLTGFCYSCCGVFVGNAGHMTWIVSVAWLPWLFLAYYKLVATLQIRYSAWLALIVYMMASGGYPAFLIISFYLILIVFICLLFQSHFRNNLRRLIFLHFLTILLALGCASIMLFSIYKGYLLSTRSGGVTLDMALFNPFSPVCFSSFILPFASFKFPKECNVYISMTNGYIGILGLVFLILSFFQKRDGRFWLVLVLSILCLLAGLGDTLPVRAVMFKWLPLMNLFRFPSVFRIYFILGFLLLAGGGFANLKSDFVRYRKPTLAISLFLISFFSGLVFWSWFNPGFGHLGMHNLIFNRHDFNWDSTLPQHIFVQSLIQIVFLFFFVWILGVRNGSVSSLTQDRKLQFILILCACDLFFSVQLNMYATISYPDSLKTANARMANSPNGFPLPNSTIPIKDFYDEKYRDSLSPLWSNTLTIKKLPGIDGYNPFSLASFEWLKEGKLVDSVWNNPIVYFANAIQSSKPGTSLANKRDVEVVRNYSGNIIDGFSPGNERDCINIIQFDCKRIAMNTNAGGDRLLVLLQNFDKDWIVTIDGKQANCYKANTTYMCVQVPVGIHLVEFEFRPKYLYLFLAITMIIALFCCTIIVYPFLSK